MTEQAVTDTLADTAAPITDQKPEQKPDPKPAEKPGSLITAADDKPVAAPADWPEDWRDRLAGGDEKALKAMSRYQSPKDVAKALTEAQARISKGLAPAKLPDDATEEQVASWRKENGIPEKPDGYLENLPSGLVIGEDDKPMVEGFLADMHKSHAKPEIVGAALDWYYKQQDEAAAAQARTDGEFRKQTEDALRSEWGPEYRQNVNAISAFLDSAPVEGETSLKDLLLGARLADGTALGDNPLALKWLRNLANEANPAGFIAPPQGGSQIKSVEDEIKKIEAFMRSDRAAYNKDGAKQARLRTLYDAQEKLSKRA